MYILLGVDIFLFLIGILSFVNLYSVTMLKRTRMYGLKKVFGISRGRLFVEMYLENLLMMAGAILLAWGIIELSSRYITHLFGESVPGTFFDWVLTGSLLVVLPLLASFVFYVRYGLKNPVSCMRFYQAGKSKSVYRQVFLFIQYAITMLLMILAFYFQHHFDFLMHTSMVILHREFCLPICIGRIAIVLTKVLHPSNSKGNGHAGRPLIRNWMSVLS